MTEHNYGLNWLDQDKLFEITKRTFEAIVSPKKKKATPPDPFTLLTQAVLTESSLDSAIGFEAERAINKTLSNEIGLWHQRILGLAPDWEDLGAAGGGVDLRCSRTDNRFGKPIVAEVKNRYNTIKAVNEKDTWDDLDLLARSSGSIAYLFQIVPKTPERYDRPWKVSGRIQKESVRCCDGATAYEMAFCRPHALKELYEILPYVLSDATGKTIRLEGAQMLELFYESFPSE